MSTHPTFQFPNGKSVSRLGYGAMRLTGQPANFGPYANWEEGKRLLRRALELGVDFIDTARAYGPGWNERLIADALHPYPEGLLLATKGGVVKKSATERHLDGSPEGMRRDCEESLRNLKVDCIDLYQLHWVDPAVPFAESLRGLAALQAEGKIRSIGLCNITAEQLQEATAIAPIASVQNRYSVAETGSGSIVDYCAGHGIAFIPYGPLGADPMKPGAPLAGAGGVLAVVARELRATPSQVALSWLLHRSPNILPIPGTTSIAHLEENVAAASLALTDDQLRTPAGMGVRV